MKKGLLNLTVILILIPLVSCSSRQNLQTSKIEKTFEQKESDYVQALAARACVSIMGNYNINQLNSAIRDFKIVEAIIGGPWIGIASEVKTMGNEGEIYKSRCLRL